jgi:hypothetical protein
VKPSYVQLFLLGLLVMLGLMVVSGAEGILLKVTRSLLEQSKPLALLVALFGQFGIVIPIMGALFLRGARFLATSPLFSKLVYESSQPQS